VPNLLTSQAYHYTEPLFEFVTTIADNKLVIFHTLIQYIVQHEIMYLQLLHT